MAFHLQLPPHVLLWQGRELPVHAVLEGLAYFLGFQLFRLIRRSEGDVLAQGKRLRIILAAAVGAIAGSKLPGIWTHFVDPAHSGAAAGGLLPAWLSGKTVAGGILFGWLAVEAAKKAWGIKISTGDAFVLPLCLALFIGRIGCFLGGLPDGTQGIPAGIPWAVDYGDGIPRHPSPLYEAAFAVLLGAVLWSSRSRLAPGARFTVFLLAYFPFRIASDFLKPDPKVALGLSAVQWTCVLGLVLAIIHARNRGAILIRKPGTIPALQTS